MVGWRGMEKEFLDLLNAKLPRNGVDFLIVGKDSSDAKAIAERLSPRLSITATYGIAPGGFSDLVINRRADKLLGARYIVT